jgi:hypothetical protein
MKKLVKILSKTILYYLQENYQEIISTVLISVVNKNLFIFFNNTKLRFIAPKLFYTKTIDEAILLRFKKAVAAA